MVYAGKQSLMGSNFYFRQIFWTDRDRFDPKIEMANMDGSQRQTVVNSTYADEPNHVFLDYANNRYYIGNVLRLLFCQILLPDLTKQVDISKRLATWLTPHHKVNAELKEVISLVVQFWLIVFILCN